MNHADVKTMIEAASSVIIVQAANPDGDSLGSSLGLEAILDEQGKKVSMHCAVDIPIHLHYIDGWDRVTKDIDISADLIIVVDTTSETLLSKTLDMPGIRHFFETRPVIIIDHHTTTELPVFETTSYSRSTAVAACEVITDLAMACDWKIPPDAAMALLSGVLSDSLGLTTQQTTPQAYRVAAILMEAGAHPATIEEKRREYMKKSPRILDFKADLIKRIEYDCDGELAVVHIPWDDIHEYSGEFNPSILVLDEMRFVEGVNVAVAIKTYPDGRVTGKVKGNLPIANVVAGYFGGGGHPYMSGFRVYENYQTVRNELVTAYLKALQEHES